MTAKVLHTWMTSIADVVLYYTRRFAILAWILLILANTATVWVAWDTRRTNNEKLAQTDVKLCRKFTKPIHDIIVRSSRSLPTITYYKTHPDELEKAMNDNRLALKSFSLEDCENLPSTRTK